jgi:hypothetical protein
MDDFGPKPRLRSLLDHFACIEDVRDAWRVAHPLAEVLLLVVCASIASCDDFDDIAAWGESHLAFLRRFLPYHHGVPCGRWLNILMNRINPKLFQDCFMAWACELRPDAPDLIAIDGKTSRRSHDRDAGGAQVARRAVARRKSQPFIPSRPLRPARSSCSARKPWRPNRMR